MKKSKKDKLSDVEVNVSDSEEPEVYALKREGSGWRLSRRDWLSALAAGGLVAGTSGLLGGCDHNDETEELEKVTFRDKSNTHSEYVSIYGDEDEEGSLEALMSAQQENDEEVIQYMIRNDRGKWVTKTGLVGTELPVGAICVCNAVCACDGDCVCDAVCACDGDCVCDAVCVCDGDCVCDAVCVCDAKCSCVGHCIHYHYWYPN